MLLIVWPRLDLIWIILNSLIFVSIEIMVCFNRSSRFGIIWLEISLIIVNYDLLIFHLRIGKLLLMLAAIKGCTRMLRITTSSATLELLLVTEVWYRLRLLILVLVWWKTHVNIHQVLRSGLFHLIFCELLLLLIRSHLLLQLLLLLLILLLSLHLVKILLPHSWLLELLLIPIIISGKIVVILKRVIWNKILMILLWSDVIIENLRCVGIHNILLFVELITNEVL